MLKSFYKKIKSRVVDSAFIKNVFAVSFASVITQVMPIFTAPILTRIYSPEDYGLLGIILVVCNLIGVFITFGYSNAIITAVDDKEAESVLALCLKSILIITTCTCIFLLVFAKSIAKFISIADYSLLIFIPVNVFLGGFSSVYGTIATRLKYFKMLAINRVIAVVASSVCSIIIGLLFKNVIGLLIGFLIGQIITGFVLFYLIQKKQVLPSISELIKSTTKVVAKKYKNFPLYSLPSEFINNFSNQIPIFLINKFSINPQAAIGHYNMSNRMLGMPISIISTSIGEVFKQRAAQDYNQSGTCRPIFLKTFKTLVLSAIIPFLIIGLFGSNLFAFAFGEKWRAAGFYSQILAVMFFFRFTISPLTYVFFVAGKQKLDFVLHQLFVVFGFLSLYIGFKYYNSLNISLWLFTISYSIIYILYFFFSFSFSKKNA
ncbi:MAG: oligosaccharide flippase family protein [Chitinophagaceae bacterium]